MQRGGEFAQYFLLEFLAYALVGIQAQYPVVPRRCDGELFLLPETKPFLFEDSGPVALRNLKRSVHAPRVDDQNLVGKTGTRQAGV